MHHIKLKGHTKQIWRFTIYLQRFGSGGGKNKIGAIKLLYLLSIRFYAVANMANFHMETETLQFDVVQSIAFSLTNVWEKAKFKEF